VKSTRAAALSKRDVELILSSLGRLFPEVSCKDTTVVLYGGEPFLPGNMEAIQAVLAFSRAAGFKVEAFTNGLNLDAYKGCFGQTAGKISAVQVSAHFPGATEEEITARLALVSHGISDVLKAKCRVNFRFNLLPWERHLVPIIEKAIQVMPYSEDELFFAYLAPIQPRANTTDSNRVTSSNNTWNTFNLKWGKRKTLQYRLLRSLVLKEGRLRPFKTSFCMSHKPNSFIVDPELNVYNCFADVGHPEYKTGSFASSEWHIGDPVAKSKGTIFNPECVGCSIALFCGGGCSSNNLGECSGACNTSGCQSKLDAFKSTFAAVLEDNRELIVKQTREIKSNDKIL